MRSCMTPIWSLLWQPHADCHSQESGLQALKAAEVEVLAAKRNLLSAPILKQVPGLHCFCSGHAQNS